MEERLVVLRWLEDGSAILACSPQLAKDLTGVPDKTDIPAWWTDGAKPGEGRTLHLGPVPIAPSGAGGGADATDGLGAAY